MCRVFSAWGLSAEELQNAIGYGEVSETPTDDQEVTRSKRESIDKDGK